MTIRSKSYRLLLVFAALIGVLVSFVSWCWPFTGDRTRPSPRLPPSPNSKHRIGAYEKDGALVTGQQHYAAAKRIPRA